MKMVLLISALCLSLGFYGQERPRSPYTPVDKNLKPGWVKSLFEKGQQKVYSGKELNYIAMPCGGIGAGQVEITGDGRLCFYESVYNQMQKPNGGLGSSNGAQYLHPQKPVSKVENNFSLLIKQKGSEAKVVALNDSCFDDIQFVGEYPIARINYRSTGNQLPVTVESEVFSPFIPLDVRSSANPVTVVKYTLTNTSNQTVEVALAGWLKNIAFPEEGMVLYKNQAYKNNGITALLFDMSPLQQTDSVEKHQNFGGFSLSVLDKKGGYLLNADNSETFFDRFLTGKSDTKYSITSSYPIGGSVGLSFKLAPNKSKDITFLVSWYFPNQHGNAYDTPGWVGHLYNNWYSNAFEVAKYVAANFDTLYNKTKLFRETYNDNTLPYWLANRITMPVSTLACGNISIWQNGRMYAYEGVGFCSGTCGHVYNFVTAIAKLFPKLERSVRLMQDLKEGVGFNPSGRINFRGHDAADPKAQHSYASDAQSGYVLKLYREHLMSADSRFLDSIWPQVKRIMGYHIYTDGADIGLEPNGVLEGLQTFWDPMWYGPNPYNNTLYLASLRAAEMMARLEDEHNLADRYHKIYEKGRAFMNDRMWNGEYYFHLYPSGFTRHGMHNGFASLEEKEKDAIGSIAAFNQGEPSYFASTACDANQLFGQNWAHQLGLGYILPAENCKTAAKSIFKFNWTSDIATVYDVWKPRTRILSDAGEGALINGSWPKERPRDFENTHDKNDIWSGLEYEAACDMINEGLLEEAFIVLRSIHDRYDGIKRNPWNEIEGSDHYSRAMHSWNVLLALGHFTYDGPAGKLGFAPKLDPLNFKSFFSGAEGWGSISQEMTGRTQNEKIEVMWGRLKLKELTFELVNKAKNVNVKVFVNGKLVLSETKIEDDDLIVSLVSQEELLEGDNLKVEIK